jgi:protein gp37
MAEETNISWADSTFNAAIGCMKVSAGCDNCYAETLMDTRYHRAQWGQRKTDTTAPSVGTRVRTSAAYWRQPLTWNKHHAAFQAKHGHRQRVFCASLSDVFDNQWDVQWRYDLWKLIWETPHLDWLLLTKRPENIEGMLPDRWTDNVGRPSWPNVWLGITAEDQKNYNKRWNILQRIPAVVRFVSYEPAIGPLDELGWGVHPDWLICGGESGVDYRPMNIAWADQIKLVCTTYSVPFFMKQVSGVKPREDQIPPRLMLRQFPRAA